MNYEQTNKFEYLTIHITNKCNLKCCYCYNKLRGNKSLSVTNAIKAIEYIFPQETDQIRLNFIGGEPLLEWNSIKKIIKIITLKRNHVPYISLTTNGTLLTKSIVQELSAIRAKIVFSIEGKEKRQISSRLPLSSKEYDKLVENLSGAIKILHNNIQARMTIYNDEDISEDIKYLISLGLKHIVLFPVADLPKRASEVVLSKIKSLLNWILQNKKGIIIEPITNIYHRKCRNEMVSTCGAGTAMITVDPSGNYYPCHRNIGLTNYVLGNIKDGINHEKLVNWHHMTQKILKKCNNCDVKTDCLFACLYKVNTSKAILNPNWCYWMRTAVKLFK